MCVTGGLKGAPACTLVYIQRTLVSVLCLPGWKVCHSPEGGLCKLFLLLGTKCCVTGVGSDCDQPSSSISATTPGLSKRLFDATWSSFGVCGLCDAAASASLCFWMCLGTWVSQHREPTLHDEHPTFPLRFFSRLYWQTYSSSLSCQSDSRKQVIHKVPIHLEHGDWPVTKNTVSICLS